MKYWQFARRCPGRSAIAIIIAWSWCKNASLLWLLILYRLRRAGAENVPEEGPLIYVANHQAHYDPMIVGVAICDRPYTAMARDTLFKFKPWGAFLRFLGSIPIDRSKGDLGAMRALLGELAAGRCVLVFPEGTRSPDGLVKPFQKGAHLLIRRASAPVVPIAIEGAQEIWSKAQKLPRLSGRLAMRIGKPIPHDEVLSRDDPLEFLRRTIETMRLELRAELRERSKGKWPPPGIADRPYWEVEGAEAAAEAGAAPDTG